MSGCGAHALLHPGSDHAGRDAAPGNSALAAGDTRAPRDESAANTTRAARFERAARGRVLPKVAVQACVLWHIACGYEPFRPRRGHRRARNMDCERLRGAAAQSGRCA